MPGLGAVPVIGALFRSSGFIRGQTELVILVTPVIVRPEHRREAARADRRLRAAERLRAHRAGPVPGQRGGRGQAQNRLGARRLNGASGFMFD